MPKPTARFFLPRVLNTPRTPYVSILNNTIASRTRFLPTLNNPAIKFFKSSLEPEQPSFKNPKLKQNYKEMQKEAREQLKQLEESRLLLLYNIPLDQKLKATLHSAALLRNNINYLKMDANKNLLQAMHEKLCGLRTYHSNAIEGNNISLGDVLVFLREKTTKKGQCFKDLLEIHNHARAIDYVFDFVQSKKQINPSFLQRLNYLLREGIDSNDKVTLVDHIEAKENSYTSYKTTPNYTIRGDGSIHHYVGPEEVAPQIDLLCKSIDSNKDEHPIITASIAHYNLVRIHPFCDGNGRSARLLMDAILLSHEYVPAIIDVKKRDQYLQTLKQADEGDLTPFIQLMVDSVIATQNIVYNDLEKHLKDDDSRTLKQEEHTQLDKTLDEAADTFKNFSVY